MDLSRIENLLNGVEFIEPKPNVRSITDLADEFLVNVDKYNIVAKELKSLFSKFYKLLEGNGLIPRKGIIPKQIVKHKYHPTVNTTYYLHEVLFSFVNETMICQCSIFDNSTRLVVSSALGGSVLWYMGGPHKLEYKLGTNDLGEFVKFDFCEKKTYSNYLEMMNQAMDELILEMERAIENFEEDTFNLISSFMDKYATQDK